MERPVRVGVVGAVVARDALQDDTLEDADGALVDGTLQELAVHDAHEEVALG